jgi:5-methylcytosine-specific restriction enzyme subunit McrC
LPFYKIPKTRKTAPYETVLEIARLIILNYAPNISSGTENMLALLFDMNKLWEEYILVRLKQFAEQKGVEVYGQSSKGFWNGMSIRPDIVLMKKDNQDEILIIDTKWKNIDYSEPSIHDLRQMYVYNEFWKSTKSLLLYPSPNTHLSIDKFITYDDNKHACSLGKISIFRDDELDINIGKEILKLIE